MLQQTRVSAVLEHYRRFLRRFPTMQKLASARESSVLAAWSGLGYYRRARMMHAAAKTIVERAWRKVSGTIHELRALPGVGRYTAAAIASIVWVRRRLSWTEMSSECWGECSGAPWRASLSGKLPRPA